MVKEEGGGRDKRNYVRLETGLNVDFKFGGEEESSVFRAITRNLSHGGICLEVMEKPNEVLDLLETHYDRILFSIELDRDSTVELEGKTAWGNSRIEWIQKPDRKNAALIIGIEFSNLPEEVKERIHAFILNEFVTNYGRDGL